MRSGVKCDIEYDGINATQYFNPNATSRILPYDSGQRVTYLKQMSLISQKQTFQNPGMDELKGLAWTSYLNGNNSEDSIHFLQLLKKYEMDLDERNKKISIVNDESKKVLSSLISDEALLNNEVEDAVLKGGISLDDQGSMMKQGYAMINMHHEDSDADSLKILDIPIDINDNKEVDFNSINENDDSINNNQEVVGTISSISFYIKDMDVFLHGYYPLYMVLLETDGKSVFEKQKLEEKVAFYPNVPMRFDNYHAVYNQPWSKNDSGYYINLKYLMLIILVVLGV